MDHTVINAATGGWPTQLDDLGEARPQRLFVAGVGDVRLLALRSVAIVGARSATPYGLSVASSLAADLAACGWVVVSGGAFGIDAAAHRGALTAGGCTVAVLASGVDMPTPRSHAPLLARISASGLLVSERPLGYLPRAHDFLHRNRLIAALTRAVVVVEAGSRSGALHTANCASTLRRPVAAVPGPVTSALSVGTHRSIREGQAVLVTDVSDVLELLEPLDAAGPAGAAGWSGDRQPPLPGLDR